MKARKLSNILKEYQGIKGDPETVNNKVRIITPDFKEYKIDSIQESTTEDVVYLGCIALKGDV
jgi:hypothetical protein